MNRLSAFRSRGNIKSTMFAMARGSKNPWDPINGFPYNPVEEHVEPKDEEIIKEIFDRNYYHYFNRGLLADNHPHIDGFTRYRTWQHLYASPKDALLTYDYGSFFAKWFYFFLPLIVLGTFLYINPKYNQITHGRKYLSSGNTRSTRQL